MSWWQRLTAGNNNTIIQAQNYYAGDSTKITIAQVQEISQQVVQHELDKFSDSAIETLNQRFDEFTLNYISRQSETAPGGFESLKQPFMQRALRTAKIEFGASGEPDIGESLVNILVDLSEKKPGMMHSILLNDALTVVPKLAKPHVAALTTSLIMTLTVMNRITSRQDFYAFLVENVLPIADTLPTDSIPYRHLVFTQTAWLQPFPQSIGTRLHETYGGIFTVGFEKSDIPTEIEDFYGSLFVDHDTDPNRVRFAAGTKSLLDAHIASNSRLSSHSDWIHNQFDSTRMQPDDIVKEIGDDVPGMAKVLTTFADTDLDSINLTSLGIVIAHANWRAMGTGIQPPLSAYLPDE